MHSVVKFMLQVTTCRCADGQRWCNFTVCDRKKVTAAIWRIQNLAILSLRHCYTGLYRICCHEEVVYLRSVSISLTVYTISQWAGLLKKLWKNFCTIFRGESPGITIVWILGWPVMVNSFTWDITCSSLYRECVYIMEKVLGCKHKI